MLAITLVSLSAADSLPPAAPLQWGLEQAADGRTGETILFYTRPFFGLSHVRRETIYVEANNGFRSRVTGLI
jgi:hypothetical protein